MGMRAAGAGLGLLLVYGLAQGAPDPLVTRAKVLFQQAEVHFSVGEFARALDLYKDAYKTKPLPGFLFNIGQCHRNLGRCDQALFFYRQYLLRASDPPNRAEVERLIEICERAAKPATRPATVPVARVVRPPPATRALPPDPPPPPPRQGIRPAWFWTGVALSVALLGTGVATGTIALRKSSEYKEQETTIARREELRDAGEALSRTANITIAAGAATAAATIVLSIFTDFGGRERRTSPAPARRVGLAPLPGGAAALLGGTF